MDRQLSLVSTQAGRQQRPTFTMVLTSTRPVHCCPSPAALAAGAAAAPAAAAPSAAPLHPPAADASAGAGASAALAAAPAANTTAAPTAPPAAPRTTLPAARSKGSAAAGRQVQQLGASSSAAPLMADLQEQLLTQVGGVRALAQQSSSCFKLLGAH
jgi:hypothetical protein